MKPFTRSLAAQLLNYSAAFFLRCFIVLVAHYLLIRAINVRVEITRKEEPVAQVCLWPGSN